MLDGSRHFLFFVLYHAGLSMYLHTHLTSCSYLLAIVRRFLNQSPPSLLRWSVGRLVPRGRWPAVPGRFVHWNLELSMRGGWAVAERPSQAFLSDGEFGQERVGSKLSTDVIYGYQCGKYMRMAT